MPAHLVHTICFACIGLVFREILMKGPGQVIRRASDKEGNCKLNYNTGDKKYGLVKSSLSFTH